MNYFIRPSDPPAPPLLAIMLSPEEGEAKHDLELHHPSLVGPIDRLLKQ